MDNRTTYKASSRCGVLLNIDCLGLVKERVSDWSKPRCVVFLNIDYLMLMGSENRWK